MALPPIIASPGEPSVTDTPESEPLKRSPLGWTALFLLFLVLIGTGLMSGQSRMTLGESTSGEESQLRLAVAIDNLPVAYRQAGVSSKDSLDRLARDLGTKPGARRDYLRAVVAREQGRPVDRAALLRAQADERVGPERVALVLPDRPEAPKEGLDRIENPRFVDRLAAAQARERSGEPRAVTRAGLADTTLLLRVGLLSLGGFGVAALGIAAWIAFFIHRSSPGGQAKGGPSLPMTPAQADQFAWRGAGMMAAFLLGSLGAGLLGRTFGSGVAEVAQLLTYAGIAFYAFTMRGSDGVPMISARRLRGEGPIGRHITWGLLAAAANLPLVILVLLITSPLLKMAPNPVHPSAEALLSGPPLLAVLKTFLFASVFAPIWEETFFRGMLFQGLQGLRWSVLASAGLSSFLFAAIHPQGFGAWGALAALAAVSCTLVHSTRSLVPSMVMHAAWNTMALSATLLMGPLMR